MRGATIKGVVTLHRRLWHTGFIVFLTHALIPSGSLAQNRLAASDHEQELNRQLYEGNFATAANEFEAAAQHLADLDRQRAEIRRFVYSEETPTAAKQWVKSAPG